MRPFSAPPFRTLCGIFIAALCSIMLTLAPAAAQTPAPALIAEAQDRPQSLTEVETGLYILRLNNVSPRDGSMDVDMWLWFRWSGDAVRPHETFELANGVIHERTEAQILNDGGLNYATVRVQATVFHTFDVRRFPLDDHVVPILIEDAEFDASILRYTVDDQIALDPEVTVSGWATRLAPAFVETHVYPTNYGFESGGTAAAEYSRMAVPVALERTSVAPLFKQFWISTLAVILGLLALLVKADDLDARYGLGLGSIFAASANGFVIAENLPDTTFITLAEQINLIAVGTIFLTLFVSVWSLRYRYADREEASLRLDRISLVVITAVYLFMNGAVFVWELS